MCLLIGMLDLCASGKKDQDAQYESNDEGEEEEEADRQEFTEYKQNLQQLFEEQLSGKHKVYLHQLGSEDPENKPTALNFREQKQRLTKSILSFDLVMHAKSNQTYIT